VGFYYALQQTLHHFTMFTLVKPREVFPLLAFYRNNKSNAITLLVKHLKTIDTA